MAIGDIYRVTSQFNMPGATVAQWVQHYRQATGVDEDPGDVLQQLANNVVLSWQEIDDQIADTVQGDNIELALWDAVNLQFDTVAQQAIASLVGLSVGDMLPHQEAAVVKFFTPVGRSIGKKFVFGFTEAQQDESVLIASALAALGLFAGEWTNIVTAGGSTFEPGNFNLLTQSFRAYTGSAEVNALLGTQDRRRPGIGI